jgi:hypothetical protein
VLGVIVLIGTFLTKQKASLAATENADGAAMPSVFGQDVTPTTLNLIVAVFAIVGIVLIVLGVVGMIKGRK